MAPQEICRICFEKTDWTETEKIDVEKLKNLLKITKFPLVAKPGLLSSFSGHLICNTCITNFHSLIVLRQLVNRSNAKVNALVAQRLNGNLIMIPDLVEVSGNLQEIANVCRICLQSTTNVAVYLSTNPKSYVSCDYIGTMLDYCNLELVHLTNTSSPILCHICWQRIQIVFAFQKHSEVVSGKVEYYCKLLAKFDLDHRDLEDILHMWEKLAPALDESFETDSSKTNISCQLVPTHELEFSYSNDHNYSKRYSYNSETTSANSSGIESEDDVPLLNRISANEPHQGKIVVTSDIVVNPAFEPRRSPRGKKRKEAVEFKGATSLSARLRSLENDGPQATSDKLLIVNKEETIKTFYRRKTPKLTHFWDSDSELMDTESPPRLTSEISTDENKKHVQKSVLRKSNQSPQKRALPALKEVISRKKSIFERLNEIQDKIDLLVKREPDSDNDDDFIELPHPPPGVTKDEYGDAAHTDNDNDGPPVLEFQGPCDYNPKFTIANTFSVADRLPEIISHQTKADLLETLRVRNSPERERQTPEDSVVPAANSSQIVENVEFRIEPFMSDSPPPPPTPPPSSTLTPPPSIPTPQSSVSPTSPPSTTSSTPILQSLLNPLLNGRSVCVQLTRCDSLLTARNKEINKAASERGGTAEARPLLRSMETEMTNGHGKVTVSANINAAPSKLSSKAPVKKKRKLFENVAGVNALSEADIQKELQLFDENPEMFLNDCALCDFTAPTSALAREHLVDNTHKLQVDLNNTCSSCQYTSTDDGQLRKHKFLQHWEDQNLKCSVCDKTKVGPAIACLKCDKQFHPACMLAEQLFNPKHPCIHLKAQDCLVVTSQCALVCEAEVEADKEPKICLSCLKPVTGYVHCTVCNEYCHYKCVYDRAMDDRPVCVHLLSFFRKLASISGMSKVKCDNCHSDIKNPVPCPKCLTFMHRKCFVDSFMKTCDHREVLLDGAPPEVKNRAVKEKKKCDLCGLVAARQISCPSCHKWMHRDCFVKDSKSMKFGCNHRSVVPEARAGKPKRTKEYPPIDLVADED